MAPLLKDAMNSAKLIIREIITIIFTVLNLNLTMGTVSSILYYFFVSRIG